jgi:hypothetical protein
VYLSLQSTAWSENIEDLASGFLDEFKQGDEGVRIAIIESDQVAGAGLTGFHPTTFHINEVEQGRPSGQRAKPRMVPTICQPSRR